MRQNLAFTFDLRGERPARPGADAPTRVRPVRTVPSFVRIARQELAPGRGGPRRRPEADRRAGRPRS